MTQYPPDFWVQSVPAAAPLASASRQTARAAKRRGVVMAVSSGGPAGGGGRGRGERLAGRGVWETGLRPHCCPSRAEAPLLLASTRHGNAAACKHQAHLERAARAGGWGARPGRVGALEV